MKKYLDLYIADSNATVITVEELQHEEKDPDVFICDEFDFMLENFPVIFRPNSEDKLTLFGLAPVFHCS